MKKVTQILIFALIGVVTVSTAKAQTYDPYAVQVINNLIKNNGLQATPDAPETWEFATWNDEAPKQIIELFLPSFYSGWYYFVSGEVSLAGLKTLEKLTCFYSPKKSQMSNPKELETMQNRTITKLNVANCTSLHTLDCRMNMELTELDLTNCTNLQILVCSGNNLSTLDVTNCIQLKELDCGNNKLPEFDVTNCMQLETLSCNGNKLSTLDVTNCTQLKRLACYYNYLTELDVTNCTQLSHLSCSSNKLTEINLTNSTQLQVLDCAVNMLTELDITILTQLEWLDCYTNKLTEIDVSRCKLLKWLWCDSNHLTELDLTGLDNLTNYRGLFQDVSLTLVKNEAEEYTRTITLNNPTFGNSAISYSDGILKSTNTTVTSTSFTAQTNKPGFELSGTMNFNYSDVGINTPNMEQLKVYPNPTTGVLHITGNRHCGLAPQSPENDEIAGDPETSSGRNDIKNIEIFDVMGKSVYVETHGSASLQQHPTTILDISNLPTGIYFVKIATNTDVIVKKVVKQ